MANWEFFNQNIGDISSALAGRAREEKAKTDAFQTLIFKSAIEQKFKEMAMQSLFNKYKEMGFGGGQPPEGSVMPGTEPADIIRPQANPYELVPTGDPDKPFKFEFNPQEQTRRKVEEQSALEENKPLQGEASVRYSGALQGIRDLKLIADNIGLSNGEIKDIKKAKDLIYKANLNIEGVGAERGVPFLTGLYRGGKLLRGGNEGAKLGNLFMTLSENLLRARTGAQAPEPEVIREYARSLLKSYIENPETWKSKLMQNEEFLLGTVKSLRPNTWKKDLGSYQSILFPKTNKTSSGMEYTVGE